MMSLCMLVVLLVIHDESFAQSITSLQTKEHAMEGDTITLSCKYDSQARSLQWYRQHPGSKPEYLLLLYESSSNVIHADPPFPRLDATVNKVERLVDLKISTAALTDSALYYCAFEPTMRVKATTLAKSLHWYRQYPGSRPKFLLLVIESSIKSAIHPEPPIPRLDGKLKMGDKQVDLEINSAAVIDSALYFSALYYLTQGFAQSITPLQNKVHATEGEKITLSCKYDGNADSLQWYRQFPGSRPEFLLLVIVSSKWSVIHADTPIQGLDGKLGDNKHVDLEISSAAVTDSALYYCALQPTVTGNTTTLFSSLRLSVMMFLCSIWLILLFAGDAIGQGIAPCSSSEFVASGNSITLSCSYSGTYSSDSLLWYRQYARSRPEFLFLVSEANFERPADLPIPGMSAKLNEENNRVDLEISSAAVTDSALYYCALQPTVTGNPTTLYKIEWKTNQAN
ncbi:uncharacterized protein LOC127441176 [Myxocyprinus asiaticus]|uniref:uncharacterized protein LOC127441176 n=1 Tax=Myxocyprinus asiaticus TaxID=70543 RepID=UPI0022238A04|nr:uncharacterized protein LOC127441176 [Myxocyprinus asiaticus]